MRINRFSDPHWLRNCCTIGAVLDTSTSRTFALVHFTI